MSKLKFDFSRNDGKIKPMNAVNNGPLSSIRAFTNFHDYKEARIPYARNHDAAFHTGLGGEFTVDVHRIFRDFDADVNDPASYSFKSTDDYVKNTYDAGTKMFYRLGASIEHYEKKGTIPPKDFQKWAEICEHIVLHYTQGWANGFYYDMEYWEIWNEPDCQNADGSNPCWQGTQEEFVDLFVTTYRHLKSKFPSLKVGGPAFAWPVGCPEFVDKLFTALNKEGLKLDFYSFHTYERRVEGMVYHTRKAKEMLEKYDQAQAEIIINEWNYVKGWSGADWEHTLRSEKGLKGSSFVAGAMLAGQKEPVDMLMYYDARPCGMNGMFGTDLYEKLKGYYPIAYFSKLSALGTFVKDECDDELIYACGATNGKDCALMLTYYSDDDTLEPKRVEIELDSIPENATIKVYVLDASRDMEKLFEFGAFGKSRLALDVTLHSTYFVEING